MKTLVVDPKFFDEQGIIKLTPEDTHHQENTPLWHITFLLRNNIFSTQSYVQVTSFIVKGAIKGSRSHDNMTAVITYLYLWAKKNPDTFLAMEAKKWIKELKIRPDYDHPRDFLYIGMIQNRWWWWIMPTIWFRVLFIIFAYMALRKWKRRPHGKFFKTDTEILYWIRTQLPWYFLAIHATRPIIEPILMIKYKATNWIQKCMELYYKSPGHPNRKEP